MFIAIQILDHAELKRSESFPSNIRIWHFLLKIDF